jgi:lipopolysaccharide/colanic/teichoic acid biosynthesis glycosyltransferase
MFAKRLIDILVSALALMIVSPLLLPAMLAIWLEDRGSPLFFAARVGQHNRDFAMVKLRSMVVDAQALGGTSTAATDLRITRVGHFIRRWKLDELPQFWTVLTGQMSLVGPRPNTRRFGVDAYTPAEMRLLTVLPGITDLASIVFADEGDILAGSADPDRLYDAVIRPWKSRLALLYVERRSLSADLRILALTALALVDRDRALLGVAAMVADWGGRDDLVRVCLRNNPLPVALPPGMGTAP